MALNDECIIIIDPVLTGTKIAIEAKKRGFQCIAIMAWKNIPPFAKKTFVEELYSEIFELNDEDDIEYIIAQKLSSKKIRAIFPGTESAVEIAEIARSICRLPTNDPATIQLRRNKYKMHMALKDRGLAIPSQIEARNIAEIEDWVRAENRNIKWPVVLKPLSSAGTDGLSFSKDLPDLLRNAGLLLHSKNLFGEMNDLILAQSFVEGTEYVVNTISENSSHKITDFWKYTKRAVSGAGMIYDRQDLLPLQEAESLGLKRYVFQALDALDIKYGPAHSEVMLTQDGPVLIETASRIQGGINTEVLNLCLGTNQLDISLDVALEPGSFERVELDQHELRRCACWINLICSSDSKAQELASFERSIKALKSYSSLFLSVEEGSPVRQTVDLMSCPGVVFLVHEDPGQIDSDYEFIRKIELNHY